MPGSCQIPFHPGEPGGKFLGSRRVLPAFNPLTSCGAKGGSALPTGVSSFGHLQGVQLPTEPLWGGHIFQSYVVLLPASIDRDQVIEKMRDRGIETTLGTYALHAEPYFAQAYHYQPGDLPNAYRAYRQSLTLPLYSSLGEDDLERIAHSLEQALQ